MRDWITARTLAPSKRVDLVAELMRQEPQDRSGLFEEEEGREEGSESP